VLPIIQVCACFKKREASQNFLDSAHISHCLSKSKPQTVSVPGVSNTDSLRAECSTAEDHADKNDIPQTDSNVKDNVEDRSVMVR